jgi:dihydroxyacetone kinase-like predicted kinase
MVPVEEWGYCTQFVVSGERLDVASVRRSLQLLAASALVVGDESLIRVHGHTQDPGQLLSYAAKLGRLQRIAIEDMDAQHDAWLRTQVADTKAAVQAAPEESGGCAAPAAEVTTVAVAPGEGLAEVFRSVGAGEVVLGGQTMNPSAQELLAAAQRTGAGTVLLLPNNANVILAARQAADLAEPGLQLVVVPTRTVPQGIAAQLAFSAEAGAEENAGVMEQAAGAVRTVEVTRATRSVTLDGMAVREGDALGLLDDQPVAVAPDAIAAAARALDLAGAATAGIITIYGGRDVGDEAARAFVDALRERYSQAEVEVVHGGQPHFDYLISVE